MEEQLINYETAVLATRVGFNKPTRRLYRTPTQTIDSYHRDNFDIPAPSQPVLQKWLRDTHKVHVEVFINDSGDIGGYAYIISLPRVEENSVNWISCEIEYSTYEEALEEGLKEALAFLSQMNKVNNQLKERGKFFKSIPLSDWQTTLDFERVVKNYLKMRELLKEQMEELPLK